MSNLDLLIITPGASDLYQDLSKKYMSIEPPLWGCMLAQSVRSEFDVRIYDMACSPPKDEQDFVNIIKNYNPEIILFVVYGNNPNSSSYYMYNATKFSKILNNYYPTIPIYFTGNHVSAVPDHVINSHQEITGVFINEGVYSLKNLLRNKCNPEGVKGIWYRDARGEIIINEPEGVVPHERMDVDLPGFAWDLLDKPLSEYRTSTWHCGYDESKVSPFASIYTSLNCPFKCDFCLINSVARNSNDLNLAADSFSTFRYWSIEHTAKQLTYLAEQGVRYLKFADEMWLLKKDHYYELSKLLKERFKGVFSIWSYSRINTAKEQFLQDVKDAGVDYLGIGLESGDQLIREEITKGKFKDTDIRTILKRINDFDISVGANWIVGLGSDNYESCNRTLSSALELSEYSHNINIYPAMDLPGSPLFSRLRNEGKVDVKPYEQYSFLGYDCVPSGTQYMTPSEVLAFRDYFFNVCFTNPGFLANIKRKYGEKALDSIYKMTSIKLKRKLLGD